MSKDIENRYDKIELTSQLIYDFKQELKKRSDELMELKNGLESILQLKNQIQDNNRNNDKNKKISIQQESPTKKSPTKKSPSKKSPSKKSPTTNSPYQKKGEGHWCKNKVLIICVTISILFLGVLIMAVPENE
ncbi:hypothetical protein ENUP19_0047G0143 [Entamoeba nuttalli]|uniref:Uncharacterized protein n=1 Tax=Entamoeba nuttalli TaxID=412467 RepID=A0ABQ0DB52_9EUKA